MKNFLRKTLIYAILSVIAVPASLYSGLLTASTVKAAAPTTLVGWNFPNNPDNSVADSGTSANASRTISAIGTSSILFNTSGKTTNSAKATNWSQGDYWQIQFSTLGYSVLTLSSKQRSSSTGPKDFKVAYSLDGTSWNDVAGATVQTADNYTLGVLTNISLPAACNNQSIVYLNFVTTSDTAVNGGVIGSTGVSNIDDISVGGIDTIAPVIVGVENNQYYNSDRTITITDSNDSFSAWLDGNLFMTGSTVSTEGSHNLVATDSAGNTSSVLFTIDKTVPTITIGGYNTLPTNQDITVTASAGVDTLNFTTHTFSQNGSFDFIATDSAGHSTTQTITITNIDKTAPVILLIGDQPMFVDKDSSFIDLGATASDNIDLNLIPSIVTNTVNTAVAGSYAVTYSVTDSAGNTTTAVRNVDVLAVQTLTSQITEVQISAASLGTHIYIPNGLTGGVLNLSGLTVDPLTNSVVLLEKIVVDLSTGLGTVRVIIPAGTKITGPAGWDGKLNLPEIVTNTAFTPALGETASPTGTIEIGRPDVALTFDKGVRILIPGQAGKNAGYIRSGMFTLINSCEAGFTDNQISGNSLPSEGDCKLDSGSDLVIWTKHFTQFVTYSQMPTKPAIISATNVQKNGNNYIDVVWNSTGADSYEVYIDGILTGSNISTSTEIQVNSAGSHIVKMRAKVSSSYSDYSNSVTVTVMALGPSTTSAGTANSPSTTASKSTALVSTARAAAPAAVTPAAASDSNGIVKAAEAAPVATTTTNWTPWIVLFILIILAGAVTGGYFYWFAGREELALATNKDVRQVNSLSKNAKETTVTVRDKPKSGDKKPNRW